MPEGAESAEASAARAGSIEPVTLRAQQRPARGRFVVKARPGVDDLSHLGQTHSVGHEGLVVVDLPSSTGNPKAAWQRVARAPGVEWAAPVLKDEDDQEHVPTGEITVRFDRAPNQTQLRSFASANGLRLRDRNEFVSEQAAFEISKPRETYLPDLIERLGQKRGVVSVWANTLSRFQKS